MKSQNNIFTYATGELSQDAFICWLLSYAMKDAEDDAALRNCAEDFIRQFIPDIPATEAVYVSEPPKKQYKSIDVLITVNDKYKIIIEDKTFTSEHDNQLNNYMNIAKADFPKHEISGIYFKTGFQSDLSYVKECGYKIFDRNRILDTLKMYLHLTSNVIFHSYYDYWENFDCEVSLFKELSINQWGWKQINGFYEFVKCESKGNGMIYNYGYVANQTGGFYGMWISNGTYRNIKHNKYELYLQCEFVDQQFNICYKAGAQGNSDKVTRSIREELIWKKEDDRWINIAEDNNFIKPSRYGSGKTVTLGIYKHNQKIMTYKDAINAINAAIASFKETVTQTDKQ